jgi:aspartate 1-decarboxylase
VQRTLLKSKLHRATVTDADLHYEGSVTIDSDLMEYQVKIYNITNGNRLTTYTLRGERGSGCIKINGAAAHLVSTGDLVIIASYAVYDEEEIEGHKPVVALLDADNRVKDLIVEKA